MLANLGSSPSPIIHYRRLSSSPSALSPPSSLSQNATHPCSRRLPRQLLPLLHPRNELHYRCSKSLKRDLQVRGKLLERADPLAIVFLTQSSAYATWFDSESQFIFFVADSRHSRDAVDVIASTSELLFQDHPLRSCRALRDLLWRSKLLYQRIYRGHGVRPSYSDRP